MEYRPRLNEQEYELIKEFRQQHDALLEECEDKGIPAEDVKHYWFKSNRFSMFVKNEKDGLEDFKTELLQFIEKKNPTYPEIKYPKYQESNLLVINPADVHVGKLALQEEGGSAHNNEIIIKRVREGINGLLSKSQGFNVDKILFVIGADILHVDNARRTTTSGTPQDTDGMWYSNFILAQKLYVEVIEQLVQLAPVHIQYDPSNHDYTNGFFLAQVIETYFKSCENITFDCSIAHRKAFQYHNNLIGTTHGDGAKQIDLPLLMAVEYPSEWSKTKHRYIYTHHVHHKTSKDYIGITVESLRSPSGTDSWHHRNGYQHAPKAVEAFLHCKDNGQIARITHIF